MLTSAGDRLLERAKAHMSLLEWLVRTPSITPALRTQILDAADEFQQEIASPPSKPV